GWALLVIGVLITGVWGASRWWEFGYIGSSWSVGAMEGLVPVPFCTSPQPSRWVGDSNASSKPGWEWHWLLDSNLIGPGDTGLNLRFAAYVHYHYGSGASDFQVTLVPWPFALASLLAGGWLVWSGRRARRRAMTGVCLKCGYDLAGLAAGSLCPECGQSKTA
ncbi:MAG: hypothetical protein ACREJO_13640, partial [Phycisphaerales bacterium]